MTFDTKYLIRWGIPGWIFMLAIFLYMILFERDAIKLIFNNNNNPFLASVTFALIGVPLGYVFNQINMFFDWVLPKEGAWNDFFEQEILIDNYLNQSDKSELRERYRYILAKKHEVGSVFMALLTSLLILIIINIIELNLTLYKCLFLIVLIIMVAVWWKLREYSSKNAIAHSENLERLAKRGLNKSEKKVNLKNTES